MTLGNTITTLTTARDCTRGVTDSIAAVLALASTILLTVLAATFPIGVNADAAAQRLAEDDKRTLYENALDALESIKGDHNDALEQLRARFNQYGQLLPFIEYRAMLRRFDDLPDKTIEGFIARHPDAVVNELIRERYLLRLAESRQWSKFTDVFATLPPVRHSPRLRCLALQAELANETPFEALAEPLAQLWSSGRSVDERCDPVFAGWSKAGAMDSDLVLRRVRLAVEAGNVKLARFIGRTYAEPTDRKRVDQWILARREPLRVLQQFAATPEPGDDNAAKLRDYAIERYARMGDSDAPVRLKKWISTFELAPEHAQRLTRKLGRRAAIDGKAYASQLLDQVSDAHHDDDSREWHIIASLRSGRHAYAGILIDALPAHLAEKSRWRYWRARLLWEADDKPTARPIFEALAQLRDYYGFLAADYVDQPYSLAEQPAQQRHLNTLTNNQAVAYAKALFEVGDLNLARLQWAFATRGMSHEELVSIALLAHQWGWHDRAILTMARAKYWDDIAARFPLAHKDEVIALARQAGLSPAWVYGVIRQESAFVNDARSSVGALGLMQLMPATAKRVARKQRVKWRGRTTLLEPAVNVRLGSAYLSELLSLCAGNAALATASYNAGPKRVKRWLPKSEPMDAQLWIETIPYAETRQFTKNVFAFTAVYEKRLGRATRRLSQKLTTIPTKAC